ncbi:tRNA (N(6)-L-threonylcarbamoyladenosine(37)-C(2))-methylthiotransferase MtaB [Veillonellaceae bacterium M2-4]|nr:tRNA (N(6)-L-threonylcarbamoyladenosine(37)-C(2))-methylthiotransferase MtaB [Veillonellaceae bacterium M2-4]
MPTIAFATLGCRVNQYDTDSMRGIFIAQGFVDASFNSPADVYVINTCSVTQMGEKKSRQLIRRAKKYNPQGIVVVTGCYAQLSPEEIASIQGVDAVIGTNEKKNIVSIVQQLLHTEAVEPVTAIHDIRHSGDTFEEIPLYPSAVEHTRADLKIQEGCNNFCTYCIIPYTRGALKSRQPDAIVEEAKRLVKAGFKELVLTGIHLGAYGKELPDKPTLAHILKRLVQETDVARLRLGSIDSLEVDEALIEVFNAFNQRICPHLHIPIQAGSNAILKAMNRQYTKEEYVELIQVLKEKINNVTFSTDLILGFPGETEELFSETMETLRGIPYSHIHAFPYSARPGTPAAKMLGQIDMAERKRRVEIVNAFSARQKKTLLQGFLHKTVCVLIERVDQTRAEGFCENYERVYISPVSTLKQGDMVMVNIIQATDNALYGIIKEDV